MKDNEELVSNETENVDELTTEELVDGGTEPITEEPVEIPVKTYTDAEVDEIVKKRLYRQEQKLNRNFEKQLNKYKYAEEVLNAGLGTSNISEATENLSKFYSQKGIELPKYHEDINQYDMEAGAEKEANSIIDSGIDDVREETDRLAQIGLENMSARDKIIFSKLAEFRKKEESKIELSQMGVKADVLETKEYKDFVKDYNLENTPVKKVYELYKMTLPQEEVEPIGSMKNTDTNTVKDYYTPDEVRRLTDKQLDNPQIMKAVENSMTKWYQEGIK